MALLTAEKVACEFESVPLRHPVRDAEHSPENCAISPRVRHDRACDWIGTSVESSLNSVVLPPPLGPRKPKISPRAISKLTSASASEQAKVLKAQNVLIKSREGVAKSLRLATWVLSIATIFLAVATAWPVLTKL
jgi:hypothetical protein